MKFFLEYPTELSLPRAVEVVKNIVNGLCLFTYLYIYIYINYTHAMQATENGLMGGCLLLMLAIYFSKLGYTKDSIPIL